MLKGTTTAEKIWNYLQSKGLNNFAIAGLMGNLYAESALNPKNLQQTYEKKLGMTDDTYTAGVDNGTYTNFVKDCAGYGLAQWTYWSRKQNLHNFAKDARKSIGDLEMQLDFLWKELQGYKSLMQTLKSATSIEQASTAVLTQYERPANQGASVQAKRASYGQKYYDQYAGTTTTKKEETPMSTKLYASKVIAVAEGELGYHEKASNANLENKTANSGNKNYTKYADDFDTEYPTFYNGKKNGYAWCDMFVDWCFVTAFGVANALKLLCQPTGSCGAGCTYSMKYYRNNGQQHNTPKVGDQIFFGTSESNVTHTGIVYAVDSSKVYTIEGNTSDCVAKRAYSLSNSTIVGYGRPNYDKEEGTPAASTTGTFEKGDIVEFTGTKHYANANASSGPACKPGRAKVTSVYKNGKHPYHLIAEKGGGSNVYGWVDAADIKGASAEATQDEWTPEIGDIVNYNGKIHYASANAASGPACKGGKAKITAIYQLGKSKHPYHLVRVSGSGATVHGWVDAGTFTKA